jgi:hypothetical protein
MITANFEAKVLAVVNSSYRNSEGKEVDMLGLIIYDQDGYEKAPTLRMNDESFKKLKLDDPKEVEKISGKNCLISATLAFSAKFGLMLNVIDVKSKAL